MYLIVVSCQGGNQSGGTCLLHKIRVWLASYHGVVLEEFNFSEMTTKMTVTEVPCINSDKDFKVADSGFALTQVYKNTFLSTEKSDQN